MNKYEVIVKMVVRRRIVVLAPEIVNGGDLRSKICEFLRDKKVPEIESVSDLRVVELFDSSTEEPAEFTYQGQGD